MSDGREVVIYQENKQKVRQDLESGLLDYVDSADWSFQDRFFAFLLSVRFFEICGASYPSPRRKEEVPVWFLLACKVQMKLHTTASFDQLPGLLKSGAILSRVKFNIGGVHGGFNNKNRKDRAVAVHHDTPRKFFKDTDPVKLRNWYNGDVVRFLRRNRAFDKHGIFILDQSHIVVPDNKHYEDAVRMPVDEHGQLIDMSRMTEEQKKGVPYHPCYAFSELLHVDKAAKSFVFSGYQWGPGNTDELVQGCSLVRDFVQAVGKGVMQLLIMDRGYIDGAFISMVKKELESDVLIPLRRNMDILTDAIRLSEKHPRKYKWTAYDSYQKHGVRYKEEVVTIEQMQTWEKCEVPLFVSVMRITDTEGNIKYWGLCTTFQPKDAKKPFELYELRTQVEERHRQLKQFWNIGDFTSPHRSLIEAHVLFTLLTYTLINLYLTKTHLNDLTNKTITSLRQEELLGKNNVIVYSNKYFAVFDVDEYTEILAFLKEEARQRLQKWIIQFRAGKRKGEIP